MFCYQNLCWTTLCPTIPLTFHIPFILFLSFRIKSQIIVLENGKVVEQGPHDVLLSKAGRYAQLWGQQNNTIDALDSTVKLGA